MIGYLRTEPAAVDQVLVDLVANGNLVIAKDYLGSAYLPEWSFNGIGDMVPGAGYQIKTNTEDVLQFLSNDQSYRLSSINVVDNAPVWASNVRLTDNNMTLIIEDAAWVNKPNAKSDIIVTSSNGTIIGSSKYTSPVTVVTLWGDDESTLEKDGLVLGEEYNLSLVNRSEIKDLEISLLNDVTSYEANSIQIASSVTSPITATDSRELVKTINVLGQDVIESNSIDSKEVLFKIYSDGSVEKIIR